MAAVLLRFQRPSWQGERAGLQFLASGMDSLVEVCERIHDWAMDLLNQHHGVDGSDSEDGQSGGHRGEDPPDNVPLENINQEDNHRRLSAILEEDVGGPADQDAINQAPGLEEAPPPYEEVVNHDDHNPDNNEEEEVTGDRPEPNDRVEGEEEPLGDLPPEAYDFPGYYVPASAPQLPSGPG